MYRTAFLLLLVSIIFVAAFFYLDQLNLLSSTIQRLGVWGGILAVVFMALLFMTPIPSEGLAILYMKIYGIYTGLLLSWLGANISSIIVFIIVRYFGEKFLSKLIDSKRFDKVNHWVKYHGTFGLFIARILPIPAFAVNYIASILPSIKFWPYLWTAAITIIPYYVGTALFYVGASQQTWIWLMAGSILLIAIWYAGYLLNKREWRN